jgi:hypothetical protein
VRYSPLVGSGADGHRRAPTSGGCLHIPGVDLVLRPMVGVPNLLFRVRVMATVDLGCVFLIQICLLLDLI